MEASSANYLRPFMRSVAPLLWADYFNDGERRNNRTGRSRSFWPAWHSRLQSPSLFLFGCRSSIPDICSSVYLGWCCSQHGDWSKSPHHGFAPELPSSSWHSAPAACTGTTPTPRTIGGHLLPIC